MKTRLYLPAWLFGLAIFAQALMLLLNAKLIWEQKKAPKSWSLDSTTYYRTLEKQGRLNLQLYEQQQAHASRIQSLRTKRTARHRHIDSLSGDALQREIDRIYNRPGRQQPTRQSTGANPDPTDGNGGAAGSEGPGRSDHAARRGALSGHLAGPATAGDSQSGPNDPTVKRAAAADAQHGAVGPAAGRPVPEEIARSPAGELAGAGRGGGLRRGPVAAVVGPYWRLFQAQGFTYPDVAWAISAVETGYWQHTPGHNLFGMKRNRRHYYESLAAGGYCRYASPARSLADYGAYERQVISRYALRSRADYLAHICRRFCPNPAYRGKLALAFQTLQTLA